MTPRIACAVALVCVSAAPAAAQGTRVIGPFAGLFGGDKGDRSQSLELRGSLFGAYDRDVVTGADPTALAGAGLAQGGVGAGGGDGTISYERRGPRAHFGLNGGGGYQGSAAGLLGGPSYSADTTLGAHLTPKLALDGQAQLMHTPYYRFAPSLVPDATTNPIPLAPGYGVAAAALPTTSSSASVSLSDSFSKRSSVIADVHWNQTRVSGAHMDGELQNFREFGATALFQHQISRPLSFHLGYGREQLLERSSSASTSPLIQTVDVGVDYADTLSIAHRVNVAFATSTAIASYGGETHYRIDGNVSLSRGFARTWQTSVDYIRSTDFLPGFGKPLLTDAVSGAISGLIAPGVHWSANAGYSFGHVGFGGASPFGAFEASSMVETAITSRVAMFVEYAFYRYKVPLETTDLPLLRQSSHHTATVGLSAWLPIIKQRKGQ